MPVVMTLSPELRASGDNCRRYPRRDGDMGIVYIHCDGDQLILSDSDRGSNTEYTTTSYYVWPAGGAEQLLFIFPTRVSLTAITLHYYSDSVRGRPRLRFYAVPDDFDVWDTLTLGNPYQGIALSHTRWRASRPQECQDQYQPQH